MVSAAKFALLLAPLGAAAEIALLPQLFQLSGSTAVNNAKLAWNLVSSSSPVKYQISRKAGSGSYQVIGTAPGDTYDDYGLTVGTAYSYQIAAISGSKTIDSSPAATVTPYNPASGLSTYDNTQTSSLRTKSKIFANGVYYQYTCNAGSNGFANVTQATSSDGYTFSGSKNVLDASVVCKSIGAACSLERCSFTLNPTTGRVVMWAHLENAQNYDLAQVASADGVPGQTFTFDGTYRPLGHDSRDIGFFADTDNKAYLISATDTNTNLNIYALTANWTYVSSLLETVQPGGNREAPSMIKTGGYYYLFSSKAAGWYPSNPEYISSTNIAGPWSASRIIGNTATYAAQSGSVVQVGSAGYVMLPDRWGANWAPTAPPNREYALPMSLSGGYASFAFYPRVAYSDSANNLFGVQAGRIRSVGAPTSASPGGGSNLTLATDGVADVQAAYFKPASVPFSVSVDLGQAYQIREVDLTTYLYPGSECYYQFTVVGSNDGKTNTTLASNTANTAVGFVPSAITNTGKFRYVGVQVNKVINTHNGNEADYFAGVGELTVYTTT